MNLQAIIYQKQDSYLMKWLMDLSIGFLASIVIGVFSPFAIYLPFSPVPIAFQINLILFLALFLGKRRAGLMVMWYLLEGALGYPVFALCASGLGVLAGPRGGYLIGYLVAAYLVGYLQERQNKRDSLTFFMHMGLGNLVVYLFGASYLSLYLGVKQAAILGVAPFVIGDFLKLTLFAKLGKKLLERNNLSC